MFALPDLVHCEHSDLPKSRAGVFSPRHDLTIARMERREIELMVEAWTEEYQKLSANPLINYVQIFENRGAMMGCSNPHPHCQIWSTRSEEHTSELQSH